MMRILLFSIAYKPFEGGAEVALDELTKRMSGVHFDIITPRYSKRLPKKEIVGNTTIHRVGWVTDKPIYNMKLGFWVSLNKICFPVTGYMMARKLHAKERFSMVWAMMANYAGFAALLFKVFNPKTPYFLSLQEGDFEDRAAKKVRFIIPLYRRIFTKADHIQVISTYLKHWAERMGYKKGISIVPNGVDIKRYSVDISHDDRRAMRSKMVTLFDEDDVIIITTSRLVHKNGVDSLIKAMEFLSHDTQLVIIGEGPQMDELKALAAKVPHGRVHFIGNVPHKDIPLYLKSADVFVRASRSEGQGISFIEAMAAGVPVVATPVGGIVDFIFDPKDVSHRATGLFADVNEPETIAQKIVTYTHDHELRNLIVSNAAQLAREKYDWDMIAEKMRKLFERTVYGKED